MMGYFVFKLRFNEDIRFEESNGVLVPECADTKILLNFKAEEWLINNNVTKCIDDNNITLENNGDLIIDDNNGNGYYGDFENQIKHNIKNIYDLN